MTGNDPHVTGPAWRPYTDSVNRPRTAAPSRFRTFFVRLRRLLNIVNLSTPAGIALARAGGCRISRGPDGLLLAGGWTWPLPRAAAFTVGNVILYRSRAAASFRPGPAGHTGPAVKTAAPGSAVSSLLRHESRHSSQYAAFGPVFLPLYFLAAAISTLRTGDPASGNVFERLEGLEDGGYRRPGHASPVPLPGPGSP
ncbi:hypothetical protein OL239_13800 [Arthrobacter sp. ATA002]|nr:hypothetical protein OL239_13800 [Arthrobacter sp. ATA002]